MRAITLLRGRSMCKQICTGMVRARDQRAAPALERLVRASVVFACAHLRHFRALTGTPAGSSLPGHVIRRMSAIYSTRRATRCSALTSCLSRILKCHPPEALQRHNAKKNVFLLQHVARARLYVSGLGYNEVFLNGERIDKNRWLDPAWSRSGSGCNVHQELRYMGAGTTSECSTLYTT